MTKQESYIPPVLRRKSSTKKPFSAFLEKRNITHHDWAKFYSSEATYFKRCGAPEKMLLSEAIKLAGELKITLDDLIIEFQGIGIELH